MQEIQKGSFWSSCVLHKAWTFPFFCSVLILIKIILYNYEGTSINYACTFNVYVRSWNYTKGIISDRILLIFADYILCRPRPDALSETGCHVLVYSSLCKIALMLSWLRIVRTYVQTLFGFLARLFFVEKMRAFVVTPVSALSEIIKCLSFWTVSGGDLIFQNVM